MQARRYAADGYTVVLVGHAGHEEVIGTSNSPSTVTDRSNDSPEDCATPRIASVDANGSVGLGV